MSKRGNIELILFLAVAVTALGGIIFFLRPDSAAPTGNFVVPIVAESYSGNSITGRFVIPDAKAYGGEVRGVYSTSARAFSGRAYELPDQSCFTCSCLTQGITAVDRSAAAKACLDNCGGEITSVVVGNCQ